MKIIKQEIEGRGTSRPAYWCFKEHYKELGKIKFVILYNAYYNKRIYMDGNDWHWTTVLVGDNIQLWLYGLAWGYDGTGPYYLFKTLQKLFPDITYKQMIKLEKVTEEPIVLENVKGKLTLKPYDNLVESLLEMAQTTIQWNRLGMYV